MVISDVVFSLYEIDTLKSPTIPYDHYSKMLSKKNIQCTPMKNLLVQMQFLTDHASKGDIVLYVSPKRQETTSGVNSSVNSCANPTEMKHLPKLMSLFRHMDLRWHVYGPFHNATEEDNVVVHYEEDFDADKIVSDKKNVLLINCSIFIGELDIQKSWVQCLGKYLKAACLKLRPLYNTQSKTSTPAGIPPTDFEYMDGKLYMQPFASQNNAEMRLFVVNATKKKMYNHTKLEECAAFFNRMVRPKNDFDNKCMQKIVENYNHKFKANEDVNQFKEFLAQCLHEDSQNQCQCNANASRGAVVMAKRKLAY